jgi:hypothetical protein
MSTPEICPNCGADVPPRAKACPECGSDEKTGWSEKAAADNLGLPDDEFNYDEFIKEEFESPDSPPRRLHWIWWVAGVILLSAFLFLFIH